MNERQLNEIRGKLWRENLDETELKRLKELAKCDPELRQILEDDLEPARLIRQMPAAPAVSSNFTGVVMQKVRLEAASENRSNRTSPPSWLRKFFASRLAPFAIMAMTLAMISAGWRAYEFHQRVVLAGQVAAASAAFASNPQFSQDIEPIRQLASVQSRAGQPDVELLALMK